MSKADGLKIGIKFTEDLVGDIAPQIAQLESQSGTWTANGTYSGTVDSVKDGNISTYWQSRSTANYIQVIRPGTKLLGVMVYKGSSYRPSNVTLRTSEDGVTYTDIETKTFEAVTGWETIMFDSPIESDYFRFNFGYSSRLYLYELVLIVEEYDNLQINDFVVTGQEYKYYNGPLLDKRYRVINYERHPTEPKSILIHFDWWGKFKNVEGDLTVEYDGVVGNLAGRGGKAESFVATFSPTDLMPAIDPAVEENLSVAPALITATLSAVEYIDLPADEHLSIAPVEIKAKLIPVGEINP